MDYKITQLRSLKRYPTYQFYAEIESSQVSSEDVFKISILETFHWLRTRLCGTDFLPSEFVTPEPDCYADFNLASLYSISLNHGWIVDVVYIPEHGVWSFLLHETDMGANPGTDHAREPVQGRTFETEISLHKQDESVELGVRTICSEPSDCTAPCEVFRPTVIRSIANHPLLSFRCGGFPIDGTPIMISSRTDAERFVSVFQNPHFNLPVVMVIDSGYDGQKPPEPTAELSASSFNFGDSLSQKFTVDDVKVSVPSGKSKDSPLLSSTKEAGNSGTKKADANS